jgi:hypothetical protein
LADPRGGPARTNPNAPRRGATLGLRIARVFAFALLAVAAFLVFPSLYCERQAKRYLTPQAHERMRVLRGAAFQGEVLKGKDRYATGSSRFDGEWMLFTYVMTASAAGQVFVRNPEEFDEALLVLRRAVERAVGPAARQFDTEAWDGEDALYALGDDTHGHGAYLVYLALALGWDRAVQTEGPWSDLHDGVIAALERRLVAAPNGVLASYPNEYYPADSAVAAAAISLHARAQGKPRPVMLDEWETRFRMHCIDPATGLVFQSLKDGEGSARGSGTAMAAWVLGGSHPQLSRELYAALLKQRYREVFGFAGIREFARGDSADGDIDSGPLMFGFSPSASAFTLGAARAQHDLRTFSRLYASAHFFGAPVEGDERRNFVVAGPLGDSVLAAALTTLEPGEYARIGQEPPP